MRFQGCSQERWARGPGAPAVCNSPCLPVDRGKSARLATVYTGVFCPLSPGLALFPLGSGRPVRKIKAGETLQDCGTGSRALCFCQRHKSESFLEWQLNWA